MLKIRLARPEDAALLNQMANASYRHHLPTSGTTPMKWSTTCSKSIPWPRWRTAWPIRSAAG